MLLQDQILAAPDDDLAAALLAGQINGRLQRPVIASANWPLASLVTVKTGPAASAKLAQQAQRHRQTQ